MSKRCLLASKQNFHLLLITLCSLQICLNLHLQTNSRARILQFDDPNKGKVGSGNSSFDYNNNDYSVSLNLDYSSNDYDFDFFKGTDQKKPSMSVSANEPQNIPNNPIQKLSDSAKTVSDGSTNFSSLNNHSDVSASYQNQQPKSVAQSFVEPGPANDFLQKSNQPVRSFNTFENLFANSNSSQEIFQIPSSQVIQKPEFSQKNSVGSSSQNFLSSFSQESNIIPSSDAFKIFPSFSKQFETNLPQGQNLQNNDQIANFSSQSSISQSSNSNSSDAPFDPFKKFLNSALPFQNPSTNSSLGPKSVDPLAIPAENNQISVNGQIPRAKTPSPFVGLDFNAQTQQQSPSNSIQASKPNPLMDNNSASTLPADIFKQLLLDAQKGFQNPSNSVPTQAQISQVAVPQTTSAPATPTTNPAIDTSAPRNSSDPSSFQPRNLPPGFPSNSDQLPQINNSPGFPLNMKQDTSQSKVPATLNDAFQAKSPEAQSIPFPFALKQNQADSSPPNFPNSSADNNSSSVQVTDIFKQLLSDAQKSIQIPSNSISAQAQNLKIPVPQMTDNSVAPVPNSQLNFNQPQNQGVPPSFPPQNFPPGFPLISNQPKQDNNQGFNSQQDVSQNQVPALLKEAIQAKTSENQSPPFPLPLKQNIVNSFQANIPNSTGDANSTLVQPADMFKQLLLDAQKSTQNPPISIPAQSTISQMPVPISTALPATSVPNSSGGSNRLQDQQGPPSFPPQSLPPSFPPQNFPPGFPPQSLPPGFPLNLNQSKPINNPPGLPLNPNQPPQINNSGFNPNQDENQSQFPAQFKDTSQAKASENQNRSFPFPQNKNIASSLLPNIQNSSGDNNSAVIQPADIFKQLLLDAQRGIQNPSSPTSPQASPNNAVNPQTQQLAPPQNLPPGFPGNLNQAPLPPFNQLQSPNNDSQNNQNPSQSNQKGLLNNPQNGFDQNSSGFPNNNLPPGFPLNPKNPFPPALKQNEGQSFSQVQTNTNPFDSSNSQAAQNNQNSPPNFSINPNKIPPGALENPSQNNKIAGNQMTDFPQKTNQIPNNFTPAHANLNANLPLGFPNKLPSGFPSGASRNPNPNSFNNQNSQMNFQNTAAPFNSDPSGFPNKTNQSGPLPQNHQEDQNDVPFGGQSKANPFMNSNSVPFKDKTDDPFALYNAKMKQQNQADANFNSSQSTNSQPSDPNSQLPIGGQQQPTQDQNPNFNAAGAQNRAFDNNSQSSNEAGNQNQPEDPFSNYRKSQQSKQKGLSTDDSSGQNQPEDPFSNYKKSQKNKPNPLVSVPGFENTGNQNQNPDTSQIPEANSQNPVNSNQNNLPGANLQDNSKNEKTGLPSIQGNPAPSSSNQEIDSTFPKLPGQKLSADQSQKANPAGNIPPENASSVPNAPILGDNKTESVKNIFDDFKNFALNQINKNSQKPENASETKPVISDSANKQSAIDNQQKLASGQIPLPSENSQNTANSASGQNQGPTKNNEEMKTSPENLVSKTSKDASQTKVDQKVTLPTSKSDAVVGIDAPKNEPIVSLPVKFTDPKNPTLNEQKAKSVENKQAESADKKPLSSPNSFSVNSSSSATQNQYPKPTPMLSDKQTKAVQTTSKATENNTSSNKQPIKITSFTNNSVTQENNKNTLINAILEKLKQEQKKPAQQAKSPSPVSTNPTNPFSEFNKNPQQAAPKAPKKFSISTFSGSILSDQQNQVSPNQSASSQTTLNSSQDVGNSSSDSKANSLESSFSAQSKGSPLDPSFVKSLSVLIAQQIKADENKNDPPKAQIDSTNSSSNSAQKNPADNSALVNLLTEFVKSSEKTNQILESVSKSNSNNNSNENGNKINSDSNFGNFLPANPNSLTQKNIQAISPGQNNSNLPNGLLSNNLNFSAQSQQSGQLSNQQAFAQTPKISEVNQINSFEGKLGQPSALISFKSNLSLPSSNTLYEKYLSFYAQNNYNADFKSLQSLNTKNYIDYSAFIGGAFDQQYKRTVAGQLRQTLMTALKTFPQSTNLKVYLISLGVKAGIVNRINRIWWKLIFKTLLSNLVFYVGILIDPENFVNPISGYFITRTVEEIRFAFDALALNPENIIDVPKLLGSR